jgi:hypothetical protein
MSPAVTAVPELTASVESLKMLCSQAWDHCEEQEGLLAEQEKEVFTGKLTFPVNNKLDPGAHYRYSHVENITEDDIKNGFVVVQMDPARIEKIYGGMTGMQFTILKKVVRMGKAHKDKRQDLLDIIAAAEREMQLLSDTDS